MPSIDTGERPITLPGSFLGESFAYQVGIPKLGTLLSVTRGAVVLHELQEPNTIQVDPETTHLDKPPIMLILSDPESAKRITKSLSGERDKFNFREGVYNAVFDDSAICVVSFETASTEDVGTQSIGLLRFLANSHYRYANALQTRLKKEGGYHNVLKEAFDATARKSVTRALSFHEMLFGGDMSGEAIMNRAKIIGELASKTIFKQEEPALRTLSKMSAPSGRLSDRKTTTSYSRRT